MIKKIAAYIFILLANITLLVHAVIPHHHHQEEVCIISSHCDDNGDNHQHPADGHHHDHNSSSNHDYCALNQIVAVPFSQLKYDYNTIDGIDYHSIFTGAIIVNMDIDGPLPISLIKTQLLLFSSNYSSFFGASFSLRGPPTV